MTFEISTAVAAPPKIFRSAGQRRITDEIKAMVPGQSVAPLDLKTKQAFSSYARSKGWNFTTQKIEGTETWRAWRLVDKESEVQNTGTSTTA